MKTTIEKQTEVENHHEALQKTHDTSHRLGIITIILIFGIFGIWSVFANIATTITANGKVISHTFNKIVMHPSGGMVKKIYVHDGDPVKKGQNLLMLDSTDLQAELDSNIRQFDTNIFAICRFETERKLENKFDCKAGVVRVMDKAYSQILSSEAESGFESDARNLDAKIALLQSKISILLSTNEGLEMQIASSKRLLASYQKELKKWEKLLKQEAVDELKAIDAQRHIEQTQQQIDSLQSKIKENLATIDSYRKQIDLEKESYQNSAIKQLDELRLKNKLIEGKIIALRNNVENSTIKSPDKGFVTDMQIHSDGEVIPPLKSIMTIVPTDKELIVEAYVLPIDIEKVFVGQKGEVSFPSYVDPSAAIMWGEVTYVSADAVVPPEMQESFYRILVKLTPEGVESVKKNGFEIMPGMPAAVFINTGETTFMKYLINPIIQLSKGIFNAN